MKLPPEIVEKIMDIKYFSEHNDRMLGLLEEIKSVDCVTIQYNLWNLMNNESIFRDERGNLSDEIILEKDNRKIDEFAKYWEIARYKCSHYNRVKNHHKTKFGYYYTRCDRHTIVGERFCTIHK